MKLIRLRSIVFVVFALIGKSSRANDPCAATWISLIDTFCTQGTTFGSVYSGVAMFPCSSVNSGDVWYKFTAPACSDSVRADLYCSNMPFHLTNGIVYFYRGSCLTLQASGCNIATTTDTLASVTYTSPTPLDTFFVRVTHFGGGNDGVFYLCVYNYCHPVSTTSASAGGSFEIFPNPSNDRMTVTGEILKKECVVELYDSRGRKVISGVSDSSGSYNLDIASYPQGIYCLTVRTGNIQPIKKLIIVM